MANSNNGSDSDQGSGSFTDVVIPATPRLARELFVRLDSVKPPLPCNDEKKLCDSEPFYTTVSRLLFQAISPLQL